MRSVNSLDLQTFLRERNLYSGEAGLDSYPRQAEVLLTLLRMIEMKKESKALNIMEVGFNAGSSSDFFLKNTSNETKVVSFDLNEWQVVMAAKKVIDTLYPRRHTLISGDSCKTIPSFYELCKSTKFDLIFVDGGHDYQVANSDLENVLRFAHKNTIVVLDDVCRDRNNIRHYTSGPTRVWKEFVDEGKIEEMGSHEMEAGSGRGFVYGKFIFE